MTQHAGTIAAATAALALLLSPLSLRADEGGGAAPLPTPPIVAAPAPQPAPRAAPAPPPATQAPAAAATAAPAEPEESWFDEPAEIAGWFTAGGGALGALLIGGLVFLSPCYCGCPFAWATGGLAMASTAFIGSAMMSNWDCGTVWSPPLLAGLIGGAGGLIGSIAAMAVAAAMGNTIGRASWDPAAFTATTLLTSSTAGAVAAAIALVAAAGGGLAVWGVYELSEDVPREPKKRSKSKRSRRSKRRSAPSGTARAISASSGGYAY